MLEDVKQWVAARLIRWAARLLFGYHPQQVDIIATRPRSAVDPMSDAIARALEMTAKRETAIDPSPTSPGIAVMSNASIADAIDRAIEEQTNPQPIPCPCDRCTKSREWREAGVNSVPVEGVN